MDLSRWTWHTYTSTGDTTMAWHLWTERIDAQRTTYRTRGAAQGLRYGAVRRDATLWDHLQGRINALLKPSDLWLLRHVERCDDATATRLRAVLD
jgi:hypothetical protein